MAEGERPRNGIDTCSTRKMEESFEMAKTSRKVKVHSNTGKARGVSAEYFEEMMTFILNWLLDCKLDNWAFREAVQKNKGVTWTQIKKLRAELELLPVTVEMRKSFAESEEEERLSLLKNFKGSTIQ
jgi:hypothetical protein